MSADIRALLVEHPCSDEWGGPDWHCGAEGCNASGCSWEDYADQPGRTTGGVLKHVPRGQVCRDHSVGLDEAGSLRAYLDVKRKASASPTDLGV